MGCGVCKNNTKQVEEPTIISQSDLKLKPGFFIHSRKDAFHQKYTFQEELGSGSFSVVFKCIENATNITRAVKIIKKEVIYEHTLTLQSKFQEIDIIKRLDHPSILRIYETFEDDVNYYIVMEYCSGGELYSKIQQQKRFTEKEVADIIWQIVSAVAYCHSNQIIHRDLKPENILLEDDNGEILVKVADFGSSIIVSSKQALTDCLGSILYVAPEVLDNFYTEKCDIWSCGIIMHVLLTGRTPFSGRNDKEISKNIKYQHLRFANKIYQHISFAGTDLLRKMLTKNPVNRPSANDTLSHSWFKQFKTEINAANVNNALNKLKVFQVSDTLKSAIRTFIATQLVSHQDTKELRKAFETIDADGDGKLSKEELINAYRLIVSDTQAEKYVDEIMNHVDTDGNGFIEYSEFLQATLSENIFLSRTNLEAAFRMFDIDNSGAISADELRDVLADGKIVDDQVWKDIIKEVDENGDGEVDFEEFLQLVKQRV